MFVGRSLRQNNNIRRFHQALYINQQTINVSMLANSLPALYWHYA